MVMKHHALFNSAVLILLLSIAACTGHSTPTHETNSVSHAQNAALKMEKEENRRIMVKRENRKIESKDKRANNMLIINLN